MKTPKISVVIPTFNGQQYIQQAINSLKTQSVLPHEIIVVDDCSTDLTYRIAEKNNVKILRHERNMGIGQSRQDGVNMATGDYISFLSSDDSYSLRFFEECLGYLTQNRATFTKWYKCNENLLPQKTFVPPTFHSQQEFKSLVVEWALKRNMFVNFSSVILPKTVFDKVKFDLSIRHGEDLVFLLDTVLAGLEWQYIPKPLVYYRIHSSQGSRSISYLDWIRLWSHVEDRLRKMGVCHKDILESKLINFLWCFPKKTLKTKTKHALKKLRFG